MSEIIELTTTTETQAQAQLLARQLVDSRLAACVQITGPIDSIYRWQGQVCEAREYRCTVKSIKRLSQQLVQEVVRQHPYETPEILVVDIAHCSDAYAQWLVSQVRP